MPLSRNDVRMSDILTRIKTSSGRECEAVSLNWATMRALLGHDFGDTDDGDSDVVTVFKALGELGAPEWASKPGRFTLDEDGLTVVGPARSWFRMALKDDVAEINLLDEIGFWGVTVTDFKTAFDQVKDAKAIRLLVNSPGGDVFAGVAIYNILSSVRAKLSVEVLGLAASAASVAALAGAKPPIMGQGTYFMIHEPSGLAWGTADDMRTMAETLDTMTDQFGNIYAERSSLTKAEVLAAMKAETWYTAEQAVEAGFASEIKDYGEAAACLTAEDARRLVLESRFDMRAETARMKREAEESLRDAGLSRSQAKAETARIFEGRREAVTEARSDSEGQDVQDADVMLTRQRQVALTTTLSRSN